MKVMIIGGSGFIGQALSKELQAKGHEVQIVTRQKNLISKSTAQVKYLYWDGAILPESPNVYAVINLAGRSIQGRWSPAVKNEILNSRLQAARALNEAIAKGLLSPKVVISGSAMGYYGHATKGKVYENSPPGNGFLAEVALRWEEVALKVLSQNQSQTPRLILLRTGVVLGDGGALPLMSLPFKFGLGATLGSGNQFMPWIHLADLTGLTLFALENEGLSGPVNACSPHPATMRDFSKTLARVLKRPCLFRLPEPLLKIAMGQMSELILFSQEGHPKKILAEGYVFQYPNLEQALHAIFK